MHLIVMSVVHNDHIFYFTKESLKTNDVGFYFDDNGHAQYIMRKSLYGEFINKWFEENLNSKGIII